MLRSALGSAHRAARAQAQRCAAESGVYLASAHMGPGSAEQRDRTMRSLSSGAHSRDPLASPGVRCTASGTRAEFVRAAVVICPSGIFVSSPLCKNISLSPSGKSSLQIRAIPPHKRGVGHRHERGEGCGGRGSVLRATGSQGGSMRPVSDHQASGREMLQRTAKSCGPDAPMLASSSRSCVGPTGLRQNISAGDGGKRARSPRRARNKS
jgi:hypothetical protein